MQGAPKVHLVQFVDDFIFPPYFFWLILYFRSLYHLSLQFSSQNRSKSCQQKMSPLLPANGSFRRDLTDFQLVDWSMQGISGKLPL